MSWDVEWKLRRFKVWYVALTIFLHPNKSCTKFANKKIVSIIISSYPNIPQCQFLVNMIHNLNHENWEWPYCIVFKTWMWLVKYCWAFTSNLSNLRLWLGFETKKKSTPWWMMLIRIRTKPNSRSPFTISKYS